MSSTTKGFLFIVLGVLMLLWFGYEAFGYLSRGGVPAEENAAVSLTLTGLKLVAAISLFVSGISSLRNRN
jgi:hypothetical protein